MVKRNIIELPVFSSDSAADILHRSIARVTLEKSTLPSSAEAEIASSNPDFGKAVKEFLNRPALWRKCLQKLLKLVKRGKYIPAALRYALRSMDELIGDPKTYREYLEAVN